MFTDILFIITTGFAMFGMYCLAETIWDMLSVREFPVTVTLFADNDNEITYRKIKYVEQNIPNNHIFIYPCKTAEDENKEKNFDDLLKDVLCVNNK